MHMLEPDCDNATLRPGFAIIAAFGAGETA